MGFYYHYYTRHPEYFKVAEAPDGRVVGYVMGKAEGDGELWHGHVTAVTVSPEYRRMGLATELMKYLEDVSEHVHNCYFVDLWVVLARRLERVMIVLCASQVCARLEQVGHHHV